MSIDVIFLGLDEVLFDSEALHLTSCNRAFREAGLPIRWDFTDLRRAAREHGFANAVRALPREIQPRHIDELVAEKHRMFHLAVLARPLAVSRATLRLIDDAMRNGCKLSILTDMPSATGAAMLENSFGATVNSTFSVVAGDLRFDGEAETGPHALALHAMGIEARDAALIDLPSPALRAARSGGIWSLQASPQHGAPRTGNNFVTLNALHALKAGTPPAMPQPAAAPSHAAAARMVAA